MLAISGLVVQGLRVRRGSDIETRAQAYAAAVLERYKSYWSQTGNYNNYNPDNPPAELILLDPTITALFSGGTLEIDTACIDLTGSEIPKADCLAPAIPPLRQVSILLKDAAGKTYADFVTEVGNPVP
jgi:hypothetical protein